MADGPLRGRFVWHELMTTDTRSAEAFYSQVVGWSTNSWEQNPSYKVWMAAGHQMGGLMALPEEAKAMGAPPHWLSYVGTPNVDRTVREAVALGGTVLKPAADIPTVGRFAVIRDPQGAIFAAFTPLSGPPPGAAGGGTPGLGDFSWHELATTDWKAALSFYQKLFGWEATSAMDMGGGNTYQMFGWGKDTFGGMFTKPKEMPGPAFWLPYAVVSDAKRTAQTIARAGGKVINGPMEVPGGDWIVQGLDLQGAVFAVHSRKPAAADKPTVAVAAKKARPARKSKPAAKARKKAARPAKKKAAKRSKPAKKSKPKKGRKASRRR